MTKDATTFDPKAMYETWEKAATAWFEAWSKSPAFLNVMGKTLEAQMGTKTQMNKMVDGVLEAWRIPSARDVEALASRIAALEERVAAIEEPATAGAKS